MLNTNRLIELCSLKGSDAVHMYALSDALRALLGVQQKPENSSFSELA